MKYLFFVVLCCCGGEPESMEEFNNVEVPSIKLICTDLRHGAFFNAGTGRVEAFDWCNNWIKSQR